MLTPKEIALLAVKGLDSKKGRDIRMLEVEHLTSLVDYFVICAGGSNTQINALCDAVEHELSQAVLSGWLPGRYLGVAGLRQCGGACIQ